MRALASCPWTAALSRRRCTASASSTRRRSRLRRLNMRSPDVELSVTWVGGALVALLSAVGLQAPVVDDPKVSRQSRESEKSDDGIPVLKLIAACAAVSTLYGAQFWGGFVHASALIGHWSPILTCTRGADRQLRGFHPSRGTRRARARMCARAEPPQTAQSPVPARLPNAHGELARGGACACPGYSLRSR